MDILILLVGLATAVERTVEYFIGPVFDYFEFLNNLSWLQRYIAGAGGVGIAYALQLDVLAQFTGGDVTTVGIIVTGLAVGGGSELIHLIIEGFSGE